MPRAIFIPTFQTSKLVMLPEALRYIVVEGVIGAGKTTLAKLLAERFQGQLVLEQFEDNPFLPRFYEDSVRWAFQTQLTFLASRFHQQKNLALGDLFHAVTVSDYAFDKDRIFAQTTLNGDEMDLYETMYAIMQPATPKPDLVVYLRSAPERLMQNIRKRGRSYEADMDAGYIAALHDAYDAYFRTYTRSPLLIVDATQMDFVANPEEREALVERITKPPREGTEVFRPLTRAPLDRALD